MKTSEFNFDFPGHLIAQKPPEERGRSRLMLLDRTSGRRIHTNVLQLPDILCEQRLSPAGQKPLLVFNDTKVRKARLIGQSCETGARTEFLLIEPVCNEERGSKRWKVMVKHTHRRKAGNLFIFFNKEDVEINRAEVTGHEGAFLFLKFDSPVDDNFLERYGHVPLPPYIKREDILSDAERYQTIYARKAGSAAAPTAGLHFTKELLSTLEERGIGKAFVTLHVGPGTFLPVRSENIEDHAMHEEQFLITEENAALIEDAAGQKRKIIAVGTTSLRALESAVSNAECGKSAGCEIISHGLIKKGWQKTSIFIYPGYKFKITDALFTNFHTPFSTLLMLVSAFAGKEMILESYAEAVREGYRFFSYGDAMLIF